MSTIWNANIGFYFGLGNTSTPKKVTFMSVFWNDITILPHIILFLRHGGDFVGYFFG